MYKSFVFSSKCINNHNHQEERNKVWFYTVVVLIMIVPFYEKERVEVKEGKEMLFLVQAAF